MPRIRRKPDSEMNPKRPRVVGIVYNGLLPEAEKLARALCDRYGADGSWWAATEETLPGLGSRQGESDLIITIGGDGTILRGVHVAGPLGIPVLGVNMGRVGFMSEIDADDALDGVGWYVEGNARVERRAMLQVEILGSDGERLEPPVDALNDLVVRRGDGLGILDVATVVDGVELATYRGDGVVVATATGSTGYCLSLGGPVMDPASEAILLKPIAAHMSMFGGVMVLPDSVLELRLDAGSPATLSMDGFLHWSFDKTQTVRVRRSPHRSEFLRREPTVAFWASLTTRLGMFKGPRPRRPVEGEDPDT